MSSSMNLSCRSWSGTISFTPVSVIYWMFIRHYTLHGPATRWQHLPWSSIWAYYWIQRNKSFRGGIQTTSLWVHELMVIIIMICTGLVGANQYNLLWINNWAIWISRGGFKFFFSLRIVVYWCHYRYFESEHWIFFFKKWEWLKMLKFHHTFQVFW